MSVVVGDGGRMLNAVLNGDNYTSWALKMEGYFLSKGWWNIVSIPRAAYTQEERDVDRRARAVILLQVDDVHALHLRGTTTAHECWQRLRDLFITDSEMVVLQLTQRVYALKYRGENMTEYLHSMNLLFQKMDQHGRNLGEYERVMILLNSLDSSYAMLVTSLGGMTRAQLSWRYVVGRITEEVNRRELTGEGNSGGGNSGGTKGKQRGASSSDTHALAVRKCFSCGSTKHLKKDCPKNKQADRDKKPEQKDRDKAPKKKGQWLKKFAALVRCEDDVSEGDSSEGEKENLRWILDSGAADHICNQKKSFRRLREKKASVIVATGGKVPCLGNGDVKISPMGIVCKHVLFVPSMECCLLSVSRLLDDGYGVNFQKDRGLILQGENVIAIAEKRDGLFVLQKAMNEVFAATAANTGVHENCVHLMHRRMGHANFQAVAKTLDLTECHVRQCKVFLDCVVCKSVKTKRHPVSKHSDRETKEPFALVHADLAGPFPTKSIGGAKYFLCLVDDHTHFSWVFPLKHKADAFQKVKNWSAWVENQFLPRFKALQSDRGGEFMSTKFKEWLEQKGIVHRKTNPYTPAENGVAERRIQYLSNILSCLLADAECSKSLWAEALATANHVINRVWTSAVGEIPYTLLFGKTPDVSYFRVFGCHAWVNIPKAIRRKGEQATQKLLFCGYEPSCKGWRFLGEHGSIVVSRSASFAEHANWRKLHANPEVLVPLSLGAGEKDGSDSDSANSSDGSGSASSSESADGDGEASGWRTPPTPRKAPKKEPKSPSPSASGLAQSASDSEQDSDAEATGGAVGGEASPRRSERSTKGKPPKRFENVRVCQVSFEPKTFSDLAKLPRSEVQKWEAAMDDEMQSMEKLHVFKRTKLPEGKKAVGCRWVFRKKKLPDGTEQYKARLVAQGFTQRKNLDYDEVYAPTVKAPTVRLMLKIAALRGLRTVHLDIKSAYLHAHLSEEIYMTEVPGYQSKSGDCVLRLLRALYGLKQSARAWNLELDEVLLKSGFKSSLSDPCLYTRVVEKQIQMVAIFVDDILGVFNSDVQIQQFIQSLNKKVEVKSLGPVRQYLGVEIRLVNGNYVLTQTMKIVKLLQDFHMEDCKPVATPMIVSFQNDKNGDPFPHQQVFQSVIGALLHLATWTRPDIASAVGILARSTANPTTAVWQGVKRVLRYLQRTKERGLVLSCQGTPELMCFADADWAGDVQSRKSTSGIAILFGNSLLHWISKKQSTVALSTSEAELGAVSQACTELVWFKQLVIDLGVQVTQPITVYSDNQTCIHIAAASQVHARSKHVAIRYCNVRDAIKQGLIKLLYCPTEENLADVFTKALSDEKFHRCIQKLGVSA